MIFIAQAEVVQLAREDFVGVGTLDAQAPGNLGLIATGTLHRRPIGPRPPSGLAPGWSAQMRRGPFSSSWDLSSAAHSAAAARGALGAWVRFSHFGTGVLPSSHGAEILRLTTANGALVQAIAINADGRLLNADPGTDGVTSTVLSLHTWYYFSAEWASGGHLRFSVQALGGAPTLLLDGVRAGVVARAGLRNGSTFGAVSCWAGRVGGAGLYAVSVLGEGQSPPADLLPPVEERHTWHVNPATGDDQNDGLAPDRAWRTVAKLNEELVHSGVLGTLTPWAYAVDGQPVPASLPKEARLAGLEEDSIVSNGDRVLIDTSAAPLYVTEEILFGDLPGVLLTGATPGTPAELLAFKPIDAAGFMPVPGSTRVFQTTDTEASVCLWEDRKFLHHPIGATYPGAVATFLENTPGSFWTDGVTLYVHPFGDTDPRSDGKSYERSRLFGSVHNCALRFRGEGNCQVDNIRLGGTTLAANDNVPQGHYCVYLEARDNKVSNSFLYYGDKHILGVINGSDDGVAVVKNVRGEQGSPYGGAGAQTVFVTYADTPRRMLVSWVDCACEQNFGLIGSAAGQSLPDRADAHYSHNAGGSGQFDEIFFKRCDFGQNRIGGAALETTRGVTLTDCSLGLFSGGRLSGDRCLLRGATIPFGSGPSATIRLTNSVLRPPNLHAFTYLVQGDITILGCTVDARAETRFGYSFPLCLFQRAGPLNLTWRNNIFLAPPNISCAIVSGATATDVLTFDHNLYGPDPLGYVLADYQDGATTSHRTLAQWQSTGQDTGSLRACPCLGAGEFPLPKSPAIDLGLDLGPQADRTGTGFTVRNDAGAFEYPLPVFRQPPTAADLTEGGSITLAATLAGNGPFACQWQRNGAPLPGATSATLNLENLLPGDSGSYTLRVANNQGAVTSQPAAVTVSAANLLQWSSIHFTPEELIDPSLSGVGSDPDADGLVNWMERALGLNPRSADSALSPGVQIENDASSAARHLVLSYRRLINAADLAYTVEVTDDSITWDDSEAQLELCGMPQPTGDRRTEEVRIRLRVPISAVPAGRKFLRLRVE